MNFKPSSSSSIIWSPNSDNKFIKVYLKQIELYECKSNQTDGENLSNSNVRKICTYNESEVIKTVSWQSSSNDENFSTSEDIIAIGLMNGVIKFINLCKMSVDLDESFQGEKEFKSKNPKPCLFLFWNPWIKNMLAQVIDKGKGAANNDPSILIWEFHKYSDNKVLTPTFNPNNLTNKHVLHAGNTVSNTTQTIHNKTSNDFYCDQPSYEFCRGDIVNSFAWISQSQFICSINNKYLKIFEIRGQNPIKVVVTEATSNLCVDIHQSNAIFSCIDDKIFIWKEETLDKPSLTYVEEANIESVEWNPFRQGYLCVTFKDRPFVKVLDTKIALINVSNEIEHSLVDRNIRSSYDINIISATWHQHVQNCILLLLANDMFELVYFRTRRLITWSVNSNFMLTIDKYLNIYHYKKEITSSNVSAKNTDQYSKKNAKLENYSNESLDTNIGYIRNDYLQFLKQDISCITQHRIQNGYGLKSQLKDYSYASMFDDNIELKTFWTWIENVSNNCYYNVEGYGSKGKFNPLSGAIDGIYDVADVISNHNTSEISFRLKAVVSRPEEVKWNHMYDTLPFPIYTHPFRSKIFSACGWPFDQVIEKWRSILEGLENKERAAAMALVTRNFDVALQYLKRIPNDKGCDSEILRLSLAGFNTQNGQASNSNWSTICKDVLTRLGTSRPYLRMIFNFLIVKNKQDLQFIKYLNIHFTDKLAFAALYMDDESLIEFFNYISSAHLKFGSLEMVTLTGLKSREFIDLLQAYVNRTNDVQTAAIAVLQANILTRNTIEKSKRSIMWIESYRTLLDNWQMWHMRADFDIASQYVAFHSNKDFGKTGKSQVVMHSKSSFGNLNPLANHNQVYVACGFCGWKISQPSKYASNLNRNSIQHKTRPDGSLYGTTTISNLAMQAGGCKSTICQHCRKPLPRCSVCLMNMGINGDISAVSHSLQLNLGTYSKKDDQFPSNPIDNWFMWCQKCKHGGHMGHLQQWFTEWNECPVSSCKCACCDLDSSYSSFSSFGQKVD